MPKLVITSKNLPDILHVIENWKGKLTWPLLCEKLTVLLNIDGVTRQALSGYKEIQNAYTTRKQLLREGTVVEIKHADSNIEYFRNQVEILEAELKKSQITIERYKQRFVKWQYNAYLHGVRMETLDDVIDVLEKPLIEIKRRTGGS